MGVLLGQLRRRRTARWPSGVTLTHTLTTARRCLLSLLLMPGIAMAQNPATPAPSAPVSGQQPPVAGPSARQSVGPSPAQTQGQATRQQEQSVISTGPGLSTSVWQWKGLRVSRIEFEGVTFDETDTLPSEITQHAGEPLDPERVRESTRRLFDSGRYRDITVRGLRQGDGMTLIFAGTP